MSTKKCAAVIIELKSCNDAKSLEKKAQEALDQIEEKNYHNPEQFPGIVHMREYGMASCHMESVVKGRYLKRSGSGWSVEGDPKGGGP